MAEILDSYDLAKAWTSPDAGDALKFKWGTVVSIDADGMLNVRIAGYDSTVSCLNWAGADVGAIVGVLCKGSLWFAIASNGGGRIAGLIQGYGGKAGKTPAGWLPCDGSTYNCADYPALYVSIGRAYTASTISADKFTVPNMGGRVALGASASYAVGATGGAETQALRALIGAVNGNTVAIGYKADGAIPGQSYTYGVTGSQTAISFVNHTTTVLRSDGAYPSTLQPYTAVNYMISTGSGHDSTGNLITAEIADGAITIADFIVEQSENRDPNAGWVWEKYANGEAKAKIVFISTPASAGPHPNSYGLHYGITSNQNFPPGLFTEKPPIVRGDILNHTNNLYVIDRAQWTSTYANLLVLGPQATNASGIMTFVLEAHGKWSAVPTPLAPSLIYAPTYADPNSFVYTTAKKDTGRTTDDGYIIWGQVFKGTITAAANANTEVTCISGLSETARLIDMWGSWSWSAAETNNRMLIGAGYGITNYASGPVRRVAGTLGFVTLSGNARTGAPYECFVDWTDGSLR